jgi:hypothetical protein
MSVGYLKEVYVIGGRLPIELSTHMGLMGVKMDDVDTFVPKPGHHSVRK